MIILRGGHYSGLWSEAREVDELLINSLKTKSGLDNCERLQNL
jgi:hypothetical protein